MYAGLDLFGRVLEEIGNPRGAETRRAARDLRDCRRARLRAASVRSPIVELRDHTWEPYVPCEATTYGRLMYEWYPADVDTGAVHLIRLKALSRPPDRLADAAAQRPRGQSVPPRLGNRQRARVQPAGNSVPASRRP